METIGILKNSIQEYEWGSRTAIAELLGEETPSARPQAEMWMGAHPKAPSLVRSGEQWVSLAAAIERHPEDILGPEPARRFSNSLPYLFKVLAAGKPLSVQAHPSMEQAREGFERENRLGIPIDAPNRNYRDPNHKPECICALTPFWALNGFRRKSDILFYLEPVWPQEAELELRGLLDKTDDTGVKQLFQALMGLGAERKQRVIDGVVAGARGRSEADPVYGWMAALHRIYPSDIGVLSPALHNLVCLQPGEAMFLPAGVPHAYLGGMGIELMANSDNVLRGALTTKHVDVPGLMRVLDFRETEADVLVAVERGECEYRYESPADEFVLSVLHIREGRAYTAPGKRSVEILLCTEGQVTVGDTRGQVVPLEKGSSAVIPASLRGYTISGNAEIYKAAVPI